ncbi:uncharacterized protein [Fopius arisanus]|uniref:Uncharacterized protein n=1 Tax=Fopius arisanus TaxID=64838 RepID=A0A9R1TE12_9HYME|nr:PREDICTED: uncharacterized protein LOC105269047 [Fopius arisanus]
MSCLDILGSQVITTLLVPQEVFLLQHSVFREYGKVAVGPDFAHTFPSLVVIAALFVLTRRELDVNFKISNKPLEITIQICVIWIIINAGLWYWLIFQRIIYCWIWSHWTHEIQLPQPHVLWWQQVWQSFYPPPTSPSPVSADFISWILSMIISVIILHGCLHLRYWIKKCQNVIAQLADQLIWGLTCLRRKRKVLINSLDSDTIPEFTPKNEKIFCDECHSDISSEHTDQSEIYNKIRGSNMKRRIIF